MPLRRRGKSKNKNEEEYPLNCAPRRNERAQKVWMNFRERKTKVYCLKLTFVHHVSKARGQDAHSAYDPDREYDGDVHGGQFRDFQVVD